MEYTLLQSSFRSGIRFSILRFVICFSSAVTIPRFPAPFIRSTLGKNLKRIFCRVAAGECEANCGCNFGDLFRGMSTAKTPYPLFVIKIETLYKEENENTHLVFDLILLEKAVPMAAFFCQALEHGYLQSREFQLQEVYTLNLQDGSQSLYYDGAQREFMGIPYEYNWHMPTVVPAEERDVKLSLAMLTPTRMKENRKLVRQHFSFKTFVKALINRCRWLDELVCGEMSCCRYNTSLLDYIDSLNVEVIKSDIEWYETQHFSRRQAQTLSVGGVVGNIVYRGNIQPFILLIAWGEIFHIGQKTNYGLGQYTFEVFE